MRTIFRFGALVLAAAALLTPAATASAKGGGGGGGACATIDSFDVSSDAWSATTTNLCLDERAGSTAIDVKNEATGFVGRSVTFGRGTQSFGGTLTAAPGTRFTITVTVYAPSGKVQASQTKSVTA